MNTQTIEKFHLIGVAIKTENKPGKAEQDIPALWGKFMSEGILQNIPNKIDDTIYCMYTDYEGDYTKPYTTIIGCRVSSLEQIPEGMMGKMVETASYVKYTAKGNIMQGAVQGVWQEIWSSDLERAYAADFDVYGDKAKNLEDGEVDIFVSVK
jgi:predicted transcriptional regulator YdeE